MSAQQALPQRALDLVVEDVPAPICELLAAITARIPGSLAKVDRPINLHGEWFIDIASGDFAIQVAWREVAGFGLFTADEGYGDQPNEVYRRTELAIARLVQLHRQWSAHSELKPVGLGQLRQLLELQQTQMAVLLDCKQSAVSRVENRGDLLLGTLQKHVHAMGGRLELRAHFPDLDVSLELPASQLEAV
jgi:hypothetical protein